MAGAGGGGERSGGRGDSMAGGGDRACGRGRGEAGWPVRAGLRTRAAVGRHVVADDGAVSAALGHDALRGVVGGVEVDVGQAAQQDVAPGQPRVAQRAAGQPLHGACVAEAGRAVWVVPSGLGGRGRGRATSSLRPPPPPSGTIAQSNQDKTQQVLRLAAAPPPRPCRPLTVHAKVHHRIRLVLSLQPPAGHGRQQGWWGGGRKRPSPPTQQ